MSDLPPSKNSPAGGESWQIVLPPASQNSQPTRSLDPATTNHAGRHSHASLPRSSSSKDADRVAESQLPTLKPNNSAFAEIEDDSNDHKNNTLSKSALIGSSTIKYESTESSAATTTRRSSARISALSSSTPRATPAPQPSSSPISAPILSSTPRRRPRPQRSNINIPVPHRSNKRTGKNQYSEVYVPKPKQSTTPKKQSAGKIKTSADLSKDNRAISTTGVIQSGPHKGKPETRIFPPSILKKGKTEGANPNLNFLTPVQFDCNNLSITVDHPIDIDSDRDIRSSAPSPSPTLGMMDPLNQNPLLHQVISNERNKKQGKPCAQIGQTNTNPSLVQEKKKVSFSQQHEDEHRDHDDDVEGFADRHFTDNFDFEPRMGSYSDWDSLGSGRPTNSPFRRRGQPYRSRSAAAIAYPSQHNSGAQRDSQGEEFPREWAAQPLDLSMGSGNQPDAFANGGPADPFVLDEDTTVSWTSSNAFAQAYNRGEIPGFAEQVEMARAGQPFNPQAAISQAARVRADNREFPDETVKDKMLKSQPGPTLFNDVFMGYDERYEDWVQSRPGPMDAFNPDGVKAAMGINEKIKQRNTFQPTPVVTDPSLWGDLFDPGERAAFERLKNTDSQSHSSIFNGRGLNAASPIDVDADPQVNEGETREQRVARAKREWEMPAFPEVDLTYAGDNALHLHRTRENDLARETLAKNSFNLGDYLEDWEPEARNDDSSPLADDPVLTSMGVEIPDSETGMTWGLTGPLNVPDLIPIPPRQQSTVPEVKEANSALNLHATAAKILNSNRKTAQEKAKKEREGNTFRDEEIARHINCAQKENSYYNLAISKLPRATESFGGSGNGFTSTSNNTPTTNCAFCTNNSEWGVLNSDYWVPETALPGWCGHCHADTATNFADQWGAIKPEDWNQESLDKGEGFSQHMMQMYRIHPKYALQGASKLNDYIASSEAFTGRKIYGSHAEKNKNNGQPAPGVTRVADTFTNRDVTHLQAIQTCRGHPFRQVDCRKAPICDGCLEEKLSIVEHKRHEKFVLAERPKLIFDELGDEIVQNRKGKDCMVCNGSADVKCSDCPLLLCSGCEIMLRKNSKGYLNALLYLWGRDHMRNDAFLLRSDGGGF